MWHVFKCYEIFTLKLQHLQIDNTFHDDEASDTRVVAHQQNYLMHCDVFTCSENVSATSAQLTFFKFHYLILVLSRTASYFIVKQRFRRDQSYIEIYEDKKDFFTAQPVGYLISCWRVKYLRNSHSCMKRLLRHTQVASRLAWSQHSAVCLSFHPQYAFQPFLPSCYPSRSWNDRRKIKNENYKTTCNINGAA